MDFNLLKMEKTLDAIKQYSVMEEIKLTDRFWAEDPSPDLHRPDDFIADCQHLSFLPFQWHDRWGAVNESRVFRLVVDVPDSFAGHTPYLRLTTGREDGYTAFNPQFFGYVNGRLIQGMDINHRLLPLLSDIQASHPLEVLLHAFAGTEPGLMELHTSLVRFNDKGLALYYAYLNALNTLLVLSEGDAQKVELQQALLACADSLDLSFLLQFPDKREEAFQLAWQLLEDRVYSRDWGEGFVELFAIGHTHIDIAWRWTVEQTRQKAQRSFATAALLMQSYPQYRFFSSQPVLYQYVKEDNPALYQTIKDLVKQGRWEAEGGMWVEADCNLPSGESLVRQIYYGKRFLKDEFEVDSKLLWMPDSFGYSPVIPQLMVGSGLKYFATSKLSWNEFNRVPHDVCEWVGPDGSSVLVVMITSPDDQGLPNSPDFSTYNATLQPKNAAGVWQRMNSKQLTRKVMMPYGYGDGGGGPTAEMLESAHYMSRGLPGLPRINQEGALSFFDSLARDLREGKSPRLHGEMYLEFHRGTYTAVASIKRQNRRAELAMSSTELMLALNGRDDRARRETIWKTMSIHQFHDVLPGSAIEEVFLRCDWEHEEIMSQMKQLILSTLEYEATIGHPDSLLVVNPLWTTLPQVLLLEGLADEEVYFKGKALSNQLLPDGRRAVYFPELPAMGYQTFALKSAFNSPPPKALLGNPYCLDNRHFVLELNKDGEICALYDKQAGRQLVKPGQALNALQLFEDRPAVCDAWNIDVNYVEKMWPITQVDNIEIREDGPVCQAIRISRSFRSSRLHQIIRLYDQLPKIDIEYHVDWQERQMLLKAAFPFDVHSPFARCGIQYGSQDRPLHQNTSFEQARFEIWAHRFIDLSEPDYGVALLMGDKYGADLLDGQLRVSLLKGSIEPWPEADRGQHHFTLSILPHQGNAFQADVYTQAAVPDRAMVISAQGLEVNLSHSLAESLTKGVALEAAKPAEDGQGVILRLCETEGRPVKARIRLAMVPRKAALCDLMENHQEDLPVDGPVLDISLQARQIRTLRIQWV